MPVLSVAHDVICPWCWVGRHQAKRLKQEFPTIEFNWLGFELLPEGLTYTPPPPDPDADKKPPVPTRLELLLAAEGLTLPKKRGLSLTLASRWKVPSLLRNKGLSSLISMPYIMPIGKKTGI